MNFDYSEDEKMLQKSVRNMLQDKHPIEKVREYMGNGKISETLTNLLASQGLLGPVSWNEKTKSIEGITYAVLTSFEVGRSVLPFPLMESYVSAYVLEKYKFESIYNEVTSGTKICTIAWEGKTMNVTSKEDALLVTGEFTYVPFAKDANYMLAKVNINSEEKVLVVNLNNENIEVRKRDSMDETYPLYNVRVKNYQFSQQDVLTTGENSTSIFDEMKMIARLLISAEMVGASEEILERTVEYTNQREQFGQSISKFQAIKHMAADMYLLLDSSKAILDYTTAVIDSNADGDLMKVTSMLKAYVSDASNEIIGTAIQVHGGIAYTWESDVHLYYKRARRSSVMLGDSYYHREKVFQSMLNQKAVLKV
ncbi:hypothetical protein BTR23_09320 [Alkalihalophilus pseudofirmus]|nr:hypothetical protein BTR23_09320 [Alkalihalophilus pseudofirmus]